MTIKFSLPDRKPSGIAFGHIAIGQVFRIDGDSNYYMKTPYVFCGKSCNHTDLSNGELCLALGPDYPVIPVTLEAKEVQS